MMPDYLRELADRADPNQVWRRSGIDQQSLTDEERMQVDTGVALRRHAAHLERVLEAGRQGKSLLITPIAPNSANSTATMLVDPPPEHAKLFERHPK